MLPDGSKGQAHLPMDLTVELRYLIGAGGTQCGKT